MKLSVVFIYEYLVCIFFFFFLFFLCCIFFFFKQKTAYEIGVRLVGSEMCIRDRSPERDFKSLVSANFTTAA